MHSPKTVADWAIGNDEIGARVHVWDDELDQVRFGRVEHYDSAGFPLIIVRLYAIDVNNVQPEQVITMQQGPYTDSGRYRIVAVEYAAWKAIYLGTGCGAIAHTILTPAVMPTKESVL